jgi:hypothetical protein|tara:strand:- start:929 stop:2092 length:1164 start_codon:yes stop_codon:yes gene_type:complete
MFSLLLTLFPNPMHGKYHYQKLVHQKDFQSIFLLVGIFSTFLGYLFLYLNYSRLGNFADILLNYSNRIDRNAELTEMRGNLPFTHFLFVGITTLFTSFLMKYQSIKISLFLLFIPIAPIFLFYIIDGERTAILKYVIGLTFVTFIFLHRKPIEIRKSYLVFFSVSFLLLGLLGNLRTWIALSVVDGSLDPVIERVEKKMEDEELISLFIPKEFPAVTFTTNQLIYSHLHESRPYLVGRSYLNAGPYLFPRTVYDAFGSKKDLSIADKFGEDMRLKIGRLRKVGFGMAPLGESFANFGYFGPLFISVVIFLWLKLLYMNFLSKYPILVLWASCQIPTLLFIHRSAFSSTFSSVMWTTAILFSLYYIAAFIYFILPKKNSINEKSIPSS